MCFGLAPGFVLRDEIADELLNEMEENGDSAADSTESTPAFAREGEPRGDAITGGAADESERPTGGPR